MKITSDTHAAVTIHLGLLVLTIIIGVLLIHAQERSTIIELDNLLNEREKRMIEIAELTDRNATEPQLAEILVDCPRRAEYDAALIQLGKLDKKDLITVQNLHESCGNFYGETKALMVQRLEHEYKYYSELVALRDFFTSDTEEFPLTIWGELIKAEQARAILLRDLNTIQEQIITELISGRNAQSSEIQKLVHEAQQMGELLSVHDREADQFRRQVTELAP